MHGETLKFVSTFLLNMTQFRLVTSWFKFVY